jgi:hypothetical protein
MKPSGVILFFLSFLCMPVWAVNPARADSTVKKTGTTEEIVLDSIEIKGHVDKPGVIILPKRVEPKIKAKELDRDFNSEVRQGVGEIVEPKEALQRVEPVKSIKKTVEKDRK